MNCSSREAAGMEEERKCEGGTVESAGMEEERTSEGGREDTSDLGGEPNGFLDEKRGRPRCSSGSGGGT